MTSLLNGHAVNAIGLDQRDQQCRIELRWERPRAGGAREAAAYHNHPTRRSGPAAGAAIASDAAMVAAPPRNCRRVVGCPLFIAIPYFWSASHAAIGATSSSENPLARRAHPVEWPRAVAERRHQRQDFGRVAAGDLRHVAEDAARIHGMTAGTR